MPKTSEGKPETYVNPVYPHSFPDPFVLKFRGQYFAYCTGDAADGNVFGILHSEDLVNWSYVGSAMEPLASRPPYYWAPEVNYDNGKFHLYYSAGNEILMEIRVAVSDRPDGGFVDAGVRLTHEEFAIDAHVFIDDDGSRYLFYATDFLEYAQIGTGTVVDRMVDWRSLEGRPRPVTRAKYDWQVYDPARKEKGGVRWYTVEGPTVLKRKGKYFEMFSGGSWKNKTYGVSFAVADSMSFTKEWKQFSDGERTLPILRTIQGEVVGPGHNSVVRGPNNRELYCVYHRWTDAGRVLAIDRMDFAGDRIFVSGPTTTEQAMPFRPIKDSCLINREPAGWSREEDEFVSTAEGRNELSIEVPSESFLFECNVQFRAAPGSGQLTIEIGQNRLELPADGQRAKLRPMNGSACDINLAANFDYSSWHLITIERHADRCRVMIDDLSQAAEIRSDSTGPTISIVSDGLSVAVSAIEVTPGFEELFESDETPFSFRLTGDAIVSGGRLKLKPPNRSGQANAKFSIPFVDFDLAANLAAGDPEIAEYGLKLLDEAGAAVAQLTARPTEMTIGLELPGETSSVNLPDSYVGNEFRQFRLLCQAGRLSAYLDGILLTDRALESKITDADIYGTSEISVEMVRLTAL